MTVSWTICHLGFAYGMTAQQPQRARSRVFGATLMRAPSAIGHFAPGFCDQVNNFPEHCLFLSSGGVNLGILSRFFDNVKIMITKEEFMTRISFSVGQGGINRTGDVATVQKLLNRCIGALTPFSPLTVDGLNGSKTEGLIAEFQRRVVGLSTPDSRVDPNGKTLETLVQTAQPEDTFSLSQILFSPPTLCFPLKALPATSYKTGMRRFGARRSGGTRKHAGADLYAPVGTPIMAMADGTVTKGPYAFYLGTQALEVKHKDFIARYGEIQKVADGIKEGSVVKRGQVIAYVGELRGLNMSMLHLELYKGTQSGSLTDRRNKPYQRRRDLMDPTDILEEAEKCLR